MESSNGVNLNNLRIEIATLIEAVPLVNPVQGKFQISVIMTQNSTAITTASTRNIQNKSAGAQKTATVQNTNYMLINIPMCFRVFFNNLSAIPVGTRFLVSFVGANVNDARIIGLYDTEVYTGFAYSYAQMQAEIESLKSRVSTLESYH